MYASICVCYQLSIDITQKNVQSVSIFPEPVPLVFPHVLYINTNVSLKQRSTNTPKFG